MSKFSMASKMGQKLMISRSLVMLAILLLLPALLGVVALEIASLQVNLADFAVAWAVVVGSYIIIDMTLVYVNKFYEFLLKDL